MSEITMETVLAKPTSSTSPFSSETNAGLAELIGEKAVTATAFLTS